MTRRIKATGSSLDVVLREAMAELAGCEPDDVTLKIDAPGLDESVAAVLTLELTAKDAPQDRPDRDEPSGDEERPRDDQPVVHELDEDVDLDAEADAAADFIEGLLDVMDLPGDLKLRVTEDHAEVELIDVGSGALIGRRGQTLEAIQELVRCVLQRQFQRRSHVKVDVEGYRARRLEKLLEKAEEAIDDVLETGESERLEPMDVFERKAVHHLVAEYEGVASRSQGREPARRVVIETA